MLYRSLILIGYAITLSSCSDAPDRPQRPAAATRESKPAAHSIPSVFRYKVVNTFPHDINAFTQGLVFHGGFLYESTGKRGHSSLRKVELRTGKVLKQRRMADEVFGEGIATVGDRIYQLAWQTDTGTVYDLETFEIIGEFKYSTEGWGLTHDGTHLIVSDGTAVIRFLESKTFTAVRQIEVTDPTGPIKNLNELEYIDGSIYANVWQTERIAVIDPDSGNVTSWIDLAGLLSEPESGKANVLNGIAWDPDNRRLFVTGKFWPSIFEIELHVK